jgi:type I restriction enzyme S subunit
LGIVNQIEHLGRSYAGVSVHQYHVVEVGDIVYTKSPLKANPFGIIKLNKGKAGIVSTLYAVYKVNQQTAYGPFVDYYFSLDANTNRYLRPLVKKGAKNDMKINNAYVLHDRIFAPTIPEQKRIASFFTVLDKKIAELKQKKNLLEQYKKGVIQKLFSQELRFKDENGKEFPKWEKKKLGEVAEFHKGKGLPKNEISENGKYECIHYGELFTKYNEKIENVISKTDVFDKPFLSVENDVLMPTSDVTPSGLATASCINKDGVILGGDVLIIRQKVRVLDGLFFSFYVRQYKEKVMKLVSGTTVYHLYGSDMKKLEIVVPSFQEQTKVAHFLSAIDEKINRTENQIQQTQQYKKGLLQKMFI